MASPERLNDSGDVLVRGELHLWGGGGCVNLPQCECCHGLSHWYFSHIPEEWQGKTVEVRVRLLDKEG